MSFFSYYWDEFLGLGRLAMPTLLVNGLEISMNIIDLIYLGHISSIALSIGALGGVYYNMIWYVLEGILSAQDSLLSHAFEIKDHAASRHWLYVSAVVLSGVTIIGTVFFFLSPIIVQLVFQIGDDLSSPVSNLYLPPLILYLLYFFCFRKTSEYILTLIPALWCHAGYRIIQKYLNCQYVTTPIIVSMIIGLCLKLFLNTILLNVANIGFIGAAISTSITRAIMLIIIFLWFATREGYLLLRDEFLTILSRESQVMVKNWIDSKKSTEKKSTLEMTSIKGNIQSRNSKDQGDGDEDVDESDPHEEDTDALLQDTEKVHAPETLHRDPNQPSLGSWKNHFQIDCLRFLALGIPGAIVLIIEMWSYEVALIVMSQIGPVSISSQQILICWTNVTFILFPLSFSIAVSIRLSRLLISQNPEAARVSALIALLSSTLFMLLSGFVLYKIRFLLGSLFTSDENIISRVRQLAPIVAIFQVVNGIQGCAQGVMRGMGRNTELVGYIFIAYWVIAMPFGLYLAFYTRPRVGITGIWYGFITGLSLLSLLLLLIICTTDWEREVRRSRLRLEKYQKNPILLQSSSMIGSRSLGGFMLIHSITDEEELDDIERIEVVIQSSETDTPSSSFSPSQRNLEL